MGTKVISKDSIMLGFAKLYLGTSSTFIANVNRALGSDTYYIGSLGAVAIQANKEFIKRMSTKNNVLKALDSILISAEFKITGSIIELTAKNLSYALGGSGSSSNLMNDIFTGNNTLRTELHFVYPNKINTMTIILPKSKIVTPSVSLNFLEEEASEVPIEILTLETDNAAWTANPYGKFVFA